MPTPAPLVTETNRHADTGDVTLTQSLLSPPPVSVTLCHRIKSYVRIFRMYMCVCTPHCDTVMYRVRQANCVCRVCACAYALPVAPSPCEKLVYAVCVVGACVSSSPCKINCAKLRVPDEMCVHVHPRMCVLRWEASHRYNASSVTSVRPCVHLSQRVYHPVSHALFAPPPRVRVLVLLNCDLCNGAITTVTSTRPLVA